MREQQHGCRVRAQALPILLFLNGGGGERIPPQNPNAPNHNPDLAPSLRKPPQLKQSRRVFNLEWRVASKLATPGSANLSSTSLFFRVPLLHHENLIRWIVLQGACGRVRYLQHRHRVGGVLLIIDSEPILSISEGDPSFFWMVGLSETLEGLCKAHRAGNNVC